MSTETAVQRVFNFSAGPAVLPLSVLEQIRDEMVSLPGLGSSVLEISHRSPEFVEIIESAKRQFCDLYGIGDDYEVLFLQGGAILQNAMVPANLMVDEDQTADYIVSGSWSKKSSQDVPFYGQLNVAWSGADSNFRCLPDDSELELSKNPAYAYYTSNETIQGVQFRQPPAGGGAPLVCDASSDILSRPLDIGAHGIIYGCAQKNCGIAGITIVVIRKDLLDRSGDRLPLYMNYAKHAQADSMANTPPTFAVYVLGLVCRWLKDEIGGLAKMNEINEHKAQLLYDVIDQSDGFYIGHANPGNRSLMNVVFKMADDELNKQFVDQAKVAGMTTLKGHRSVGGIRASIYNAMPTEGVQTLAEFMQDFAQKYG